LEAEAAEDAVEAEEHEAGAAALLVAVHEVAAVALDLLEAAHEADSCHERRCHERRCRDAPSCLRCVFQREWRDRAFRPLSHAVLDAFHRLLRVLPDVWL